MYISSNPQRNHAIFILTECEVCQSRYFHPYCVWSMSCPEYATKNDLFPGWIWRFLRLWCRHDSEVAPHAPGDDMRNTCSAAARVHRIYSDGIYIYATSAQYLLRPLWSIWWWVWIVECLRHLTFLSIYLFFVSLSLLFLSLRGIKSVAIKWKQCGKYTRHEASPHPYSIAYRIYLINKVPRESCTGSCCGWNFIPTVLRVVDVVSDPWWNLFLFKAPDK